MINVPRETADRLIQFENLVVAENGRQNLISPSTIADIRTRHTDDSFQLLDHIDHGVLIDIGTGAGFPGMVLACARSDPTHLIEPRARRAAFLQSAVDRLGLTSVHVWQTRVERVTLPPAATITARAVAPLTDIFAMAIHLSCPETRWVLPKGRSAQSELDAAQQTWQGRFELVASRTDPESAIILATEVSRRRRS